MESQNTKRSVIISIRIDQRYCVLNLTELRLTQCTAVYNLVPRDFSLAGLAGKSPWERGWAVYFGLSVAFINRAPVLKIALLELTSLVPVPSQFNYFTLP